ncbi:unnamed protein product, partial [Callosobruchus maculatus]
LKCCGVSGSEYWVRKKQAIPESCKEDSDNYHPNGCLDVIAAHAKKDLRTMGIVLLVLGLTEVLAIVLACCELLNIRDREKRRSRTARLLRYHAAEQTYQEAAAQQRPYDERRY